MEFTQDTFFSDLDGHQIVCPLPIPWNELVNALKAKAHQQIRKGADQSDD